MTEPTVADVLRWHYLDHPQVTFEECKRWECRAAVLAHEDEARKRAAAAMDRAMEGTG